MTATSQENSSASERLKNLPKEKLELLEALLVKNSTSSEKNPGAAPWPEGETNLPPRSSLVLMKPSGSKPPFFCVHAIFGSIFPYHYLAMHMEEDQPFYGLQSPGLDGEQAPLEKIEELASFYIETIKSVQPQGPYYLGGYSFGGWVAFEMAQQLLKAKDKVAFLAVLGTGVPPSTNNPKLGESIGFLIDYLKDYNKLVLHSFLSDAHRIDAPQIQPPFLSPLYRVVEANNYAQLRYVPQSYADKITVFVTTEQQAMFAQELTMGWQMLSEHVEVVKIAGSHLNIFYEPQVQELAKNLTACLSKAQAAV